MVYYHRVSISADVRGMRIGSGEGATPQYVTDKLRESLRSGCAARMVWADARLLEPGHPLRGILPQRDEPQVDAAATKWTRETRSRWSRVLPWVAAVLSATVGFWVFLQRTP